MPRRRSYSRPGAESRPAPRRSYGRPRVGIGSEADLPFPVDLEFSVQRERWKAEGKTAKYPPRALYMKETRALDFRSSNDRRLALTQPVDVGATTEATARLRDRYWQDKRGVWRSRESGRVVSRARINRARAQYLYHARMRALAAQREISITEAKKLWRADPDAAMESLGQSPRGTGPEDPAIPDDLGPGGEL